MPDWKRFVRQQMRDLPIQGERLAVIELELAEHLESAYEEALAAGSSEQEAKRQAQSLFDWEQLDHELRQVENLSARRIDRYRRREERAAANKQGVARALDSLWRDARYGLRSLSRTPALTITIVLTVGLGIGAGTALFAVIHSVLLRPLPYPDSQNLVRIYTDSPPNRFPLSVADYRALDEQQTSFSRLAGYRNSRMTFTRGQVVEQMAGKFVTPGYFSVLGITPLHGRVFNESDGLSGNEASVIVSHDLWTRHLDGDQRAIGRTIRLDAREYTVVGVLPREVGPFERDREFFAAVQWQPPSRKGPFFITAIARLRPEVESAAAVQELRAICSRIFPIWQSSWQNEKASWGMMSLREFVVGDVGRTLLIVFGAVGFLLLIASTNAANLLLARAMRRRRELAVRAALGASRRRLLQQLLSESVVLGLASALVGVVLTLAGVRLVVVAGGDFIPRTQEIAVDGPVLLFLAAVTAAAGLLFGLVPSWQGARYRFADALHSGGRSSSDTAGARRLRPALVVGQVTVAMPLLIGAGLMAGSLINLMQVDPGFNPNRIVTARISLPARTYPEAEDVLSFWDRVQERVNALPGVEVAALGNARPPRDTRNINNFDLEAFPTPPSEAQPAVPWVTVTPDYFRVYGIPLLRGRLFTQQDGDGTADPVVVVDQAWAERFFAAGDALGQRFREGGRTEGPWTRVIGIVGDVKYLGLDDAGEGAIYSPMRNDVARSSYLFIRAASDPESVLPSVRSAVRELDPTLPLSQVATAEDLIDDSIRQPRYLAVVVGAFASVAVLLSVIGIYGVMSHFVQQHTKDIGIQMALGGGPAQVLRQVLGRGMQVVGLGILLGWGAALVLTQYMSSLLFEVTAMDAAAFVAAATLMLAVAAAACFFPARRAAALDPALTLRQE